MRGLRRRGLLHGAGQGDGAALRELRGRKRLAVGNHGRFLNERGFDHSLFEWERACAEVADGGRRVVLCHCPVFRYNRQRRTDERGRPTSYMAYGHAHDTQDERLPNRFIQETRRQAAASRRFPDGFPLPCNMLNVFCMFSGHRPLTLGAWIELDARRRAGTPLEGGGLAQGKGMAPQ